MLAVDRAFCHPWAVLGERGAIDLDEKRPLLRRDDLGRVVGASAGSVGVRPSDLSWGADASMRVFCSSRSVAKPDLFGFAHREGALHAFSATSRS